MYEEGPEEQHGDCPDHKPEGCLTFPVCPLYSPSELLSGVLRLSALVNVVVRFYEALYALSAVHLAGTASGNSANTSSHESASRLITKGTSYGALIIVK